MYLNTYYKSTYFANVLDNKVKKNILAISETADDIAIGLGFDIEDQIKDDFSGVYKIEYFNNENLIEIPRNIKPDKYTIKHTKNNKKNVSSNDEPTNILDYFSDDDESDLTVKDIIVGKKIKNTNKKNVINENKIESEIDNNPVDSISSEIKIIELIKN